MATDRRLTVDREPNGRRSNVWVTASCRKCGTVLAVAYVHRDAPAEAVAELAATNATARPCCGAWLPADTRRRP